MVIVHADPLRINGPSIFGVHPGSPFLYRIAATGDRPVTFAATGLPAGLQLDPATGVITGQIAAGQFPVTLEVRNAQGSAHKAFRIVAGDRIGLTPAMGWNSWNCWAADVDQEKVRRAAEAMVRSGLADHGWTYVNIDDTWQGRRSGETHALQGNQKFPDLSGLCDQVHGLGVKVGIYSTPWITSYAGFVGGTSNAADGAWGESEKKHDRGRQFGRYSFAEADARQWAAWGIDYLKYDWWPNDLPHVREMAKALRKSGRDILFSLSNAAPIALGADLSQLANSWRTTGDIRDVWIEGVEHREFFGVSEIGFAQDQWGAFAGPGHFNDPDMLVLGQVGWKAELHATQLTPDEQRTHFTLWCLLSAPLLLGCDLERIDDFTHQLLTNEDVIALDQDARGIPAKRVATSGAVDVYLKPLEDGGVALGFFNRGDAPVAFDFAKLNRIGLAGAYHVRDLWRQSALPEVSDARRAVLRLKIPAHGVILYQLTPGR